ncbi:MAG TPA: 16S rRNA (guanine(527)-N(7))-methyltransferase RsmG [Burkholderiales bacterium]|nr:16S rRNA (guanine(527)-N(7))-methyltransferase RsmG [Burkholderiales bacterium]
MSGERRLASGLEKLGLPASGDVPDKLLRYVALIAKWNRVYNLTAVRDQGDMACVHILDSLAVLPHLKGRTLLDVGSGAGLPGIPLAIARPDLEVTLLDSNQKKTSFQQQAAIELSLANVCAVNVRVESWDPAQRFDVVISRAFAEIADFVSAAGRLCADGGVLVAMKGISPDEELSRMPAAYRARAVVPLAVPGVDAERHLVLIERAA